MAESKYQDQTLIYKERYFPRTLSAFFLLLLNSVILVFVISFYLLEIHLYTFVFLLLFLTFVIVSFIALSRPFTILTADNQGVTFKFVSRKYQTHIPWEHISQIRLVKEKTIATLASGLSAFFFPRPYVVFSFTQPYEFGWRVTGGRLIAKLFLEKNSFSDLYIDSILFPESAERVVAQLQSLARHSS